VKQLSAGEDPRVIRDLDEATQLIKWLRDSVEENRAELEVITEPVYIYRLQGENRALNKILDKVPEAG
jgi:hypothetical protein